MEKIDGVEAIRQAIEDYYTEKFNMKEQYFEDHLTLKKIRKLYAEDLYKMGVITCPPERLSIESISFNIYGSDRLVDVDDEYVINYKEDYAGNKIDENMTISDIKKIVKEHEKCEMVVCSSINFSEKPLENKKIISLKFKYENDGGF